MKRLATHCPHCGHPLPPDSPEGHCPACLAATIVSLAKEGADGDAEETGSSGDTPEEQRIRIKGYELFEELGSGGMGVVYRARQIEARRFVALKVLDRGLVPPGDSIERFFREGPIVASLMAPEQVSGGRAPPEPRSDIDSLGAMLYHLLTGRPPFQADTLEAVLLQVVDRDPVALRRLNPNVPRDLEAICLKCLEKEPWHRYPTAAALADDLDRFLDHAPIRARPLTVFHRLWRHSGRRPAVAALAATCMAVALAGLAGVLWQWRQAERARGDTQQANVRLQTLVSRLRLEQADNLVRSGELRAALPRLAWHLREAPLGPVTPARIVGLLSSFNYLLPLRPPIAVAATANSAALSPDGRLVALTGEDRVVQVIDIDRAGSRIVAHGDDAVVRVWDARTGAPWAIPVKHTAPLLLAEFTPDGRFLFHNELWARGQLWQFTQTDHPGPPIPVAPEARAAQFSPDGRRLATGGHEPSARFFDLETGAQAGPTLAHPQPVREVRYTPDGKTLVTATIDNAVWIWDVASGTLRLPPMRLRGAVHRIDVSPDGQSLLTLSGGAFLNVWDLATGKQRSPKVQVAGDLLIAQFVGAGQRWITVTKDGVATLRDTATGLVMNDPFQHGAAIHDARVNADGTRLLMVGADQAVSIWEIDQVPVPVPDWLAGLAEAVAGERTDLDDLAEPVPAAAAYELRRRLETNREEDFYSRWARWFFRDRGQAAQTAGR